MGISRLCWEHGRQGELLFFMKGNKGRKKDPESVRGRFVSEPTLSKNSEGGGTPVSVRWEG